MTSQETTPVDLELDEVNPIPWRKRRAPVTNGWLLYCGVVFTAFLALGMWAGVKLVRLDNQVTRERLNSSLTAQISNCQVRNETRSEGKQVALGHVKADHDALDADRSIWFGIDAAIEGGIPADLRQAIFDALDAREATFPVREALIERVYQPENCEALADL